MVSQAVLDSSPAPASPPIQIPRPLKRSASTASLPTPPRTHHKRKGRSRSGGSALSSSDDDSEDSDVGHEKSHKKQKRENDKAEDEDAFWMGSSARKMRDHGTARVGSTSRSPSPVPLLYRRKHKAPVSPPPSRRQTIASTSSAVLSAEKTVSDVVSPPVTPKRGKGASRAYPFRDTPNNPFLEGEGEASGADANEDDDGDLLPRTPPPEKPSLTYVFRGVRAHFRNPHYNPQHASSFIETLPMEHPDFSPDPACPPKLLFPEARRVRRKRDPDARKPAPLAGGGSFSEEEVPDTGKSLFPIKERSPRTRENTVNAKDIGERGLQIEAGTDDPIRRAMGPRR